MNKPKKPKIALPLTDIEDEFRAQLKLLRKSCEEYDKGDEDEYRRIAVALRILLYDRGQSKSVAGQLGLKSAMFKAFSPPVDPANLITEMPMIMMEMNSARPDPHYRPVLGTYPASDRRLLSFDQWWSEEVFKSPGGITMDRAGMVMHVADQAGGAHVDPELDEVFHKIAKENEAGWMMSRNGQEYPFEGIERAYLRQIGYEVLETLEPEWGKILGNRGCDCGSGRKRRYCCGKTSNVAVA